MSDERTIRRKIHDSALELSAHALKLARSFEDDRTDLQDHASTAQSELHCIFALITDLQRAEFVQAFGDRCVRCSWDGDRLYKSCSECAKAE